MAWYEQNLHGNARKNLCNAFQSGEVKSRRPKPTRVSQSNEAKYPFHLAMARDLILTFGDFRKAAQRQNTATTGSTSSSRFLRTAFSSRRLTAISAMFEGLPLRAGRFAFSALGTDCSLVLISSARYLDCRNRGTRFLLRDFARGSSSRRGKHPEQQGKQEKHKPLRGKSVHACSYASSHQHRDPRGLFSARLQQQQIDTGRN